MDADGTLGANAAAMLGFAESLHGAAEHLQGELAELEGQVGDMLGGWRGAAGSAFASAWELWRRGAGEVQFGLSMLAESVGQAGAGYQANEAASARALRELGHGRSLPGGSRLAVRCGSADGGVWSSRGGHDC
ncbi:EsaT-6 like protein EsxF [Mycobacterium ulcerans Agy99]|uniref:EsaT-6 like protein EsxF n=1 Tax=Mycobacterium ulcerans (strain Agy99) TaxID=362242 RepID=A0PX50_MYCUA|nr:EsaT-6 like protein EsxF [Mycobacterium ulcerans Agy99]